MQKKLTYLLFFIALFFTFNQLEAACNWKNRNPYFYPSDSCNTNLKKYSVNGYIAFQYPGSCLKYTWKVNGNVVGTSNMVIHPVTSNGTYVISVTVRDTCNNCDTTFTSSRTISCIPKCNWKAKNLSILGGDSCSQYPYKPSIRVFLYGSTSCAKYTWKVNGNFVSNGLVLNYKATQNGTYNLSVNVRDTCNNCDTTYTKSVTITCATNCNWKGKNATFSIYDSCSTYKIPNFISGIYFQNNSSSCMKYTWKVNGTTIYTGTRNYISYYPKQNGTYNVTVNVRDTCNNCDTTYTQSLTVTCASKCNWKSKNATFYINGTIAGSQMTTAAATGVTLYPTLAASARTTSSTRPTHGRSSCSPTSTETARVHLGPSPRWSTVRGRRRTGSCGAWSNCSAARSASTVMDRDKAPGLRSDCHRSRH